MTTMQELDHLEGAESGTWRSKDGRLSCGFLSFMGKRLSMEDRYDIREEQICTEAGTEAVYLFGIFDGHGGAHAADYLKENLFMNLIKHPNFITATDSAIRETYNRTDGDFLRAEFNSQRDDGSTASTAILIGNRLYVANVGDSRAVISKAGEAVQLSDDHKPNRIDERRRIENAGGVVMWAGTWRVGGVLAMSRAFGDRLLKQFVVADPEIRVETVDERLEFLLIASDGLWDSVSNEEAMKVVASESRLDVAARNLTEKALCGGSGDNITCIVVKFHHTASTVSSTNPACSSPVDSSDHQSTIPFPPPTAVDSSSAGTACTSVVCADSLLHGTAAVSSAGSADSHHNGTGADPTLAVSLDATMPKTRDYPSADNAVLSSSTASSSGGRVDSALDAVRPSPAV